MIVRSPGQELRTLLSDNAAHSSAGQKPKWVCPKHMDSTERKVYVKHKNGVALDQRFYSNVGDVVYTMQGWSSLLTLTQANLVFKI